MPIRSCLQLAAAVTLVATIMFAAGRGNAAESPVVTEVEFQPLAASVERLVDAMDYLGAPIGADHRAAINAAIASDDEPAATKQLQAILDQYVLAAVHINPESRVKAQAGPAVKELTQNGWRAFLVKVHNEAGVTAPLRVESPQAAPIVAKGKGSRQRPASDESSITAKEIRERWVDLATFDQQPLKPALSGLPLEYRIVQIYSRDAGSREATLSFHVGQGTQDLGFRSDAPILFRCLPAVKVKLTVLDEDGDPTTAAFTVRDALGRVYPHPGRRLAPDFFFHQQVYRQHGETLQLPPGDYDVAVSRGPEYPVLRQPLHVPFDAAESSAEFHLERWTHAAKRGWISGDHHVHAAGCAHYDSPTEGVTPGDMLRHIIGEDLNVGCVLSWGPCWYAQKQFFEGKTSDLSLPNYLMRYDVEVSGFPSSHCGHLCLLRLTEDDYPGTELIEQWPSWTQPVLEWGKSQNAVVGYSHSGWGLALPDYMPDGSRKFTDRPWGSAAPGWNGRAADKLPDQAMPRFDGIGANEYVVTAANDACDFISAVDTPAIWELNVWYHTLNCGLRARISGETDFPCIYGDKVGLGRVYVKLPLDKPIDYDTWVLGLKDGRSYCGDGLSHLYDFRVGDVAVGEPGSGGKISQLDLAGPDMVTVTCDATALLEPSPTAETEAIRSRRLDEKPYWHLERCRIGDTRNVAVEVIVNGTVAARREIAANGSVTPLSFEIPLEQSAWVAMRILPSVHTNPVFVEVGGRPVRASIDSAKWCREAVDVCWNAKQPLIRAEEKEAAKAAYDRARAYYDAIRESLAANESATDR